MTSRTSGGLIKLSTALDEDMVTTLDRLAEDRGTGTTRNDVIREALRLGMPVYEQQTRVLESMRPKVGTV